MEKREKLLPCIDHLGLHKIIIKNRYPSHITSTFKLYEGKVCVAAAKEAVDMFHVFRLHRLLMDIVGLDSHTGFG